MFRKAFGAGDAIFHGHDSHSFFIKIASDRGDFETRGAIAVVTSAGVDYLDGICGLYLGEMPFDIGDALMVLEGRHLAFGPDVFFFVFGAVVV